MANIEKTYRHDKLGLITVVWKSNMRSVRMSFKKGNFTISAPVGYSMETIVRLINENEQKMLTFIKRHEMRREETNVDENFILDTHFAILRISLTSTTTPRLKKAGTIPNANPSDSSASSEKDNLVLEMPYNTEFESPETIAVVKNATIAMLRYEAKKRLPRIVKEIADANGFKYSSVKINSAQTRWGSCSSKGSLNFSLYLMLMPLHLIRSVVVHELCHTKHMDHSTNFWALFDKTYGISHKIVDKEIRELKMPGFLKN
jgi:predicted metal-dependent hydrolase